MGGSLAFESEPGKGSRFFFTLPLMPASREIPHPSVLTTKKVAHLAKGYSVKALVVDDMRENREVLSQILDEIGVEVITAENGLQAIEQVRAHQPDIVFMDIRMPVMDGMEAARQILTAFEPEKEENEPTTPSASNTSPRPPKLVAISASAFAHEQERYVAGGFDAFIAKPLLADEIYAWMASLLPIEYAYEAEQEPEPESAKDFANIPLSEDLLSRLMDAASRSSSTRMNHALDEVSQLGPSGHQFAEHLRRLFQGLEIDAILEILSEIERKRER